MQGMYFRIFFVLNRVRVSNLQIPVEFPRVLANLITCLPPEIPRKNCFYPIHPKARAKMAVSLAVS